MGEAERPRLPPLGRYWGTYPNPYPLCTPLIVSHILEGKEEEREDRSLAGGLQFIPNHTRRSCRSIIYSAIIYYIDIHLGM